VEVEDHPLDYGDFEGTIPQGEYGGGTVMLWDRGFWATEDGGDPERALRRGELKFTLAGEKLQGSWVIVHMRHDRERSKRNNWLLIKHRDGHERESGAPVTDQDQSVASGRSMEEIAAGKGRRPKPFMLAGKAAASDAVWHSNRNGKATKASFLSSAPKATIRPAATHKRTSRMPQFIAPQLCKRVSRPPTGKDWVHEIKLDGYRMQLRVEDGHAAMRTRKGLDWTEDFAAIAEAATGLEDCIIDGEVVALDHNGAPDFSALQAALWEGRSKDLTYFVFDVLHAGGEDVRRVPLTERKERLQSLVKRSGRAGKLIKFVEHLSEPGDAVLPRRHHLQVRNRAIPVGSHRNLAQIQVPRRSRSGGRRLERQFTQLAIAPRRCLPRRPLGSHRTGRHRFQSAQLRRAAQEACRALNR
jgi:bifunctional non-homologous end joining protein LigD